MNDWHINTRCLQEGWKPENGQPRILPIYQSTTYKYDSTEEVARLFDLTAEGHMYSRISNPTVACVEDKIASLEGGVGALCTSSGQAATLITFLNLAQAGDHIVSSATIYGGSWNLLDVTLRRLGIETTFVNQDAPAEEIARAIRPNTKALFGETLANPKLSVLDFDKFSRIAREHKLPLVVDNTFATPVLCRPFEHGADIVIHSASKYMDGHATCISGVIVDSGRFDWTSGRFPLFTSPDPSYHGLVYSKAFKEKAFITKARVQFMRDLGASMTAQSAFLLNLGLETLHLRIERHSANALTVARHLAQHPSILSVNYPGLEGTPWHNLTTKYLPDGTSGVISFLIRGGREAAAKFMNRLKLASIVVHVADARTSVLHPASSTHRQLSDEQLVQAGIDPGMIRFSVGIEDVRDIIADIDQALG